MGKLTIKLRILGLLVLLIFISFKPNIVHAVSSGGISVFPAQTEEIPDIRSWFVYDDAEPGSTIIDKVQIFNEKDRTVSVNIAVLDGAVTKSGGYTLVGKEEENKDLGTWATLSENFLTLPPKSHEFVDLEIKVPEDADVGSHPGGVVIWEGIDVNENSKNSGQISIRTRVAARIYITVPGDIFRGINITNVRHTILKNVLYFNMNIENLGNVQISPVADVHLQGLLGKIGVQNDSQIGLALRGTSIETRIPWQKKAPIFGRFTADIRIHYGEKDFKNEWVEDLYQDVSYTFWLIPWISIAWWFGALFILLLVYRFWFWIRIRQRLNTKTTEHTVKKNQTLTSIANDYDISPKKIAKFNLLKWPYDIFPGDVLLIPQGKLTKAEKGTKLLKTKEAVLDGKQSYEPVIAEPGDTLADVAIFANSDVRTIASINKLRWPYRLYPGQELLIPLQGSSAKVASSSSKRKTSRVRKSGKKKKSDK